MFIFLPVFLNVLSSVAQSCWTLCDLMNHSMPGRPVQIPLKPMSIELVMPSNHLILYRPLLLSQSFPASGFFTNQVFSNESVLCISWLKYWSFSFSISPSNEYSNEYSGLISFRMDWLDLLLGSYFNDVICVFIYLQRGIY